MKNKLMFGSWEIVVILLNSMGTPMFLNFPRGMVETAGTAAWLLCIYITALALLGFFIISRLYRPFYGMDPIDIGERIGGSFGRIIVGLIIITHISFIISMILREFGEDMKVISFTVSPISFILAFFVVTIIFGAYKGVEAISRMHSIVVPFIALGVFVIVLLVSPYMVWGNVLPILGNGLYDIFVKGFFRVSSFSALLLLFILFPFIKSEKVFKTAGYAGILLTGFFMLLLTSTYIMVLPYPISLEQFLPVFELARVISVGRFFQRIESLFMLIWAAAAMLYLSLTFFLIVHVFKKTFKLEYYKPLIFPFIVLVFTISLMPANVMTAIRLETDFFRNYAWVVTFGLTTFLLLIARFMEGKNKRRSKI